MGCMRFLMTIFTLLLSATTLFAEKKAEKSEVVVFYRHDKHSIDHHYLSNPEAFATLDSLFANYSGSIDSISIVAYASPEGRMVYNQWLSEKRAESMKRFLKVKYPKTDFSNLVTYAEGEDFDGLIRMVEEDKKVPHRKEVLKILRNKNLNKDARMKRLYKLRGGYPYRYIRKHILPYLRTATTCIIYWNQEALAALGVVESVARSPLHLERVGGGKMLLSLPLSGVQPAPYRRPQVTEPSKPAEMAPQPEQLLPAEGVQEAQKVRPLRDYLVAAKTNLLFDAVGAVNIGAELPINNRWSLDLNWTFPWYVDREWDWCYELLWGDVEMRYWLFERTRENRLLGHFVGLYAGGGLYDFQLRSTDGYQGEFFIAAGVSYGYAMELSNRWRLEFELGLGYLQSDYRHYFHVTDASGEELLIRDKLSGRISYWGPTKAKVSLVIPIEWSVNHNRTKRVKR